MDGKTLNGKYLMRPINMLYPSGNQRHNKYGCKKVDSNSKKEEGIHERVKKTTLNPNENISPRSRSAIKSSPSLRLTPSTVQQHNHSSKKQRSSYSLKEFI
ncbi:hypothetical protein DINM_004759 [Dirofilaria immitis]|nr:hypothetical protein [Dirofilaria immitis]